MTEPAPQRLPSLREQVQQARKDPRFQHFLSQSFGQKVIATEDDIVVTGYVWRGCVFVTSIQPRYPG